jgi:hypothetical protein
MLDDKSRAYEVLLVASGSIVKLGEGCGRWWNRSRVCTATTPLQISYDGNSSHTEFTQAAEGKKV